VRYFLSSKFCCPSVNEHSDTDFFLKKRRKLLRKVKHEFVAGDSLWGADREVGQGGTHSRHRS